MLKACFCCRHSAFRLIPVVILKAIHLSNFPLSEWLLSNLLLTCCTGEAGRMVHSLQCTDDMICDRLSTRPAKLQAGLRSYGKHTPLCEQTACGES